MNITEFLNQHGLYAERAYNMSKIDIKRKSDDSVAFILEGSKLSLTTTKEEVIELIKEKLHEKK